MQSTNEHQVIIPLYDGALPLVSRISKLVESKYSEVFYAVIVHGSVATNEVIPYSDFDGLLIVKDQFVNSKALETFKRESMEMMLRFDPLQHHGWFQIKESDLGSYPEDYLPVSTLSYSKCIFPKMSNLKLDLKLRHEIDYKKALVNMLNQFEWRSKHNWKPKNSYQLKSMLSQVMLIPCLYFSVMHNDGIFKKDSFKAVQEDFSSSEWMPIVIATDVRQHWVYKMNGFQKLLLQQPNTLIRKIATRFFAPKIAPQIQEKLDNTFYKNLMIMVEKIKREV
ncbi:nucleotidyltransferase domain-containing protein [uncultured Psychroserpens sp.]|uniref:nucleotidyltransferase domain-containing protein n=1 Tax=uncultured Psychroserpens sp. TaxID=255436 RepID=UPI00262C773E|nr:nucleotidyltransferase domain-containing protein [uncultured Psychroserpens sp.]